MELLEELNKTKFPSNYYRKIASNNSACKTMTFGLTGMNTRTWISKKNKSHEKLYRLLVDFGKSIDPNFIYTSITVNDSFKSYPHYDNNDGISMITALGDFTGGRLIIEGNPVNIQNKIYYFNGKTQLHWTEEFIGRRFCIIYFTRKVKASQLE